MAESAGRPPKLGVAYVPYGHPPERLHDLAVAADAAGLDELWVWEDCFRTGGVAAAAAALAWTSRIRVGIGLLPAPLRAVAVTAMEIATLERLFPGRLIAGVGHGVQAWMGQAGVRVASPLTLLREYVDALRRLLAGEEVSVAGRYVRLDRVALDWPPPTVPPMAVGGSGPRSIALAGEIGDAFLLAAAQSDDGIAAARSILAGSGPGPLTLVATQIVATGPGAAGRVAAEVLSWREPGPVDGIGSAGDAATVAADVRRLAALGVTSVILQPTQDEPDLPGLIEFFAHEVRPLLAADHASAE